MRAVGQCSLRTLCALLLSAEAATLSCRQRQLRPSPLINVGPPTVQAKLQKHPQAVLGASIGVVAASMALLMVGLARLAHSCHGVNREQKYWSKRRKRCTAMVGVFTALEVGCNPHPHACHVDTVGCFALQSGSPLLGPSHCTADW